ncbi:MAG: hypothetical protein PHC29_08700 [Candidatus Omnitrophica bacterium]|nr:hypothetical protein [Candidatus Omnitrophota bacterium]
MLNLFRKAWKWISNFECFEGTYYGDSVCGADHFSPNKGGFLVEIERLIKSIFWFLPMFYFILGVSIWYIFSMIFPEWVRIPGLEEESPFKKQSGFKKLLPAIFISSLVYFAVFGVYMFLSLIFNKITLRY